MIQHLVLDALARAPLARRARGAATGEEYQGYSLLCPLLPEEGFGFPGAGATGALPDLGTGNETQVLWTEQAPSHPLPAQGCVYSHSAPDCQCD